jgi:hypothetical protein
VYLSFAGSEGSAFSMYTPSSRISSWEYENIANSMTINVNAARFITNENTKFLSNRRTLSLSKGTLVNFLPFDLLDLDLKTFKHVHDAVEVEFFVPVIAGVDTAGVFP